MTATLPRSDAGAIARLDATDQAALVQSGQITAAELVEAAIERIERLNSRLNAVITPTFDRARAHAAAGPARGPFSGVPYLLKDLAIEDDGVRFTEGSRFLAGNTSRHDQELTRRLRQAGLIICGKTNTPEFGLQPTTEPLLHGPTRNPWDLSRTTGGSSGGSAAAVASGMVPFAHGNDLGGSIRFPASACGLFGFKPSRARNPLGPEYGDVGAGFAVEHALTRSVRDSAALLDATAGPSLGDPYPSWPAPPEGFAAAVRRDPGRLRVAYTSRTPGGQVAHPDCVAALESAIDLLASLGHVVSEVDLPGLDDRVGHAIGVGYGAFVTWVVDYWTRIVGRSPTDSELEPYTWAMWQQGKSVTAGAYLMAIMDLQAFSRTIADFFTHYDIWLTPTLAAPPLPLGAMVSTPDDPWRVARVGGPFVAFPAIVANITGAPAMSVPLHWTSPTSDAPQGLPIGVHALTGTGNDALLFSLAGQLERARPWAHRWPALAFEEMP